MKKYDLCIIGGGPSGYAAAMRAVDLRKKVLLVERDKIGGAGIFNGALTSKTMWELSTRYYNFKKQFSNGEIQNVDLSFDQINKTVSEAVYDRKTQLQVHIKLLQEKYGEYFTYERGHGVLLTKNEVLITKKNKVLEIYADNIIIATGSRPRCLTDIPADEKTILTSDGIGSLKKYPKSIVIVGAGVIGCEFTTIFSNFGKTQVYLIDKADHILPFEDRDITRVVADNFEKKGVVIHKNATLKRMEIVDGEVEYELEYQNGKTEIIKVEKALLSVGRVPNIEGLGLKQLGVEFTKRGHIVNDDTQTTIDNIYVVGDLSGHIALVNVGELEGRRAVERIFNYSDKKITYENVSTIMFLDPEVAAVGMNEMQAREQNLNYRLVKFDYSCIARAIAMRRTEGFFKIMVTDDDEMKILGMRAIGEHASSAIQAVALLISMDKGIAELADLIHPHPSIIEGIQDCLRMLLNKSIFKAEVFEDKLKCYRYFEGEIIPMEHLSNPVEN